MGVKKKVVRNWLDDIIILTRTKGGDRTLDHKIKSHL